MSLDQTEGAHGLALEEYRDIANRYAPHSREYRNARDRLTEAEYDLARETLLARIANGEIQVDFAPGQTLGDVEVIEVCDSEYFDILWEIQSEAEDNDYLEPDPDDADDLAKNWVPVLADPAEWTQEELERAALENRNDIAADHRRESVSHASERTIENFVRHCLSDYESILSRLEGTENLPASYALVREKIDEAVQDFLLEVAP